MINALFVLIVFLLQLNKDQIHVQWPFGVKTNITYVEETAEVSKLNDWPHGSVRLLVEPYPWAPAGPVKANVYL